MSQRWTRSALLTAQIIGAVLIALAPFRSNLHAQERTGEVRGTVFDPAGQRLADARVSIVETDFSAITDRDGTYRFAAVPVGTYSLRAEFAAYLPVEMHAVRILPGQTLSADFRLASLRPPPIEEADTCPDPMVPRAAVLAKAVPSPLPERVHGVPLTETFWGDEASSYSDAALGPGARSLVTWVGVYGHADTAVEVGAHRLGCANAARAELRRLAARLDSAVLGRGQHTSFDADGVEVHALSDRGRLTYVFARDAEVWWVAAPEELARRTLAGLLHLPVQGLPDPATPKPGAPPDE